MSKNKLIIGIVLIVIGVLVIIAAPKNAKEPDYECAGPGQPYSGFVDGDCNLTDEDYKEFLDYQSANKPLAVVGLVAVVAGLGVSGWAVLKKKL